MTDISSDIWRIKRPETIYFETGTQFPLKITSLIIIFLLSAHEDGGESAAWQKSEKLTRYLRKILIKKIKKMKR